MQFEEISGQIERVTGDVAAATAAWSDDRWHERRKSGAWSRIEVVGHLVDSARNNTERVVRALSASSLEWPGYNQEEQVRVQRYHHAPTSLTMSLWVVLNRHLAHVVQSIPEAKRATPCTIHGWQTLPLDHLVIDYTAHLEHHVRQIFEGTEVTVKTSGLAYPLY